MELTTKKINPNVTKLRELVNNQTPAIIAAMGKKEIAESFVRSALTLINLNPALQDCDGMSFLGALMQAAQLKLDLSLGQAWIIPYYSSKKGGTQAQFQVGYQGMIDLFYRHQLASELYAEIVYANDAFDYQIGTDRKIIHRPKIGERGDMVAVYAVAKLSSGAQNFAVMSVDELHRYKAHYARADRNGKYGVWDSDFEAMAKKTAIKQVLKYMPKAVEIQRALFTDSTVTTLDTSTGLSIDHAQVMQITDESEGYVLPKVLDAEITETKPEPVEIVQELTASEKAVVIADLHKQIYEQQEICRAQQIPGYGDDKAFANLAIKRLEKTQVSACIDHVKLAEYLAHLQAVIEDHIERG